MGRYYLNVRNGETLTRDPTPYLLATAEAARELAIAAVRDLLRANLGNEELEQKRIEIADETGHPIAFVELEDVRSTTLGFVNSSAGHC